MRWPSWRKFGFSRALGGILTAGLIGLPAWAGGAERQLHEGDQLGYDEPFDIRLYDPTPEDDPQLIHTGNDVDVWITQVRKDSHGQDAWYYVTINLDWHDDRARGWVRAADLNALPAVYVKHDPNFEANNAKSTPQQREETALALEKYLFGRNEPSKVVPGDSAIVARVPCRDGPDITSTIKSWPFEDMRPVHVEQMGDLGYVLIRRYDGSECYVLGSSLTPVPKVRT